MLLLALVITSCVSAAIAAPPKFTNIEMDVFESCLKKHHSNIGGVDILTAKGVCITGCVGLRLGLMNLPEFAVQYSTLQPSRAKIHQMKSCVKGITSIDDCQVGTYLMKCSDVFNNYK